MPWDSTIYCTITKVRPYVFTLLKKRFLNIVNGETHNSQPYVVKCDQRLRHHFLDEDVINGFTGSNVGFYGPQGRHLRLPPKTRYYMIHYLIFF